MAVSGDYVYVAAKYAGLLVIDVANPGKHVIVTDLLTPSATTRVAIAGSYAYVLDLETGLHVIDITNPRRLRALGSVDTPGSHEDVAIVGDYAYIADDTNGLQVIDISNPEEPQALGNLLTGYLASDVAVAGTHAFVGDWIVWDIEFREGGLRVIDISDPRSLQMVASVNLPGGVSSLAIADNYAYVATYHNELWIFDIMDPQDPQLMGSSYLGIAESMAVAGDRLYATSGAELLVLPVQCDATLPEADKAADGPAVLRLAQNLPNPFNPRTTFSYTLPASGHVTLAVYSLRGARVATLVDAEMPAGEHAEEWSGRDERGVPVPSGVYIARLETPQGVQAVKVTLAK